MARKKLNQIRTSFQRIFSLTDEQMKQQAYIELRQQALTRVSIWDGNFPGETLEDKVNVRQMDKASRQDNPHEIANYLRRLKCVGNEKDDWSCIFYAFKNYVYGKETPKDLELANKLFGGKVREEEEELSTPPVQEEIPNNISNSGVDTVVQDQKTIEPAKTEEPVTNKQDVQEGAESLPHRSPEELTKTTVKEKEKKTMANVTDVEALLQQAAAGGEAAPGASVPAPVMNPTGAAAPATTSNMIDITNVGSQHMTAVSGVVDAEWGARVEWSAARKIKKILCPGRPAAQKLWDYTGPDSNIMGTLANPADKVLDAIATTLYSVDQNKRTNAGKTLSKQRPENGVGYIYDEATKEPVVPDCVRRAGQQAVDDFKAVVKTLVEAGSSQPQFKVKISKSKPSITAVSIEVSDGRVENVKLAELKDMMVTNSKLELEYANYNANDPVHKHSLLAASAVNKIDARNINNQGSYIKLVFGNRGQMFDSNTGDLTEYGHGIVDFMRTITNEKDEDPRAVTSEVGFQYKTVEGKTRTYSLRVKADMKMVQAVEEYRSILGATAGGNVVRVDDEALRKEAMRLLGAITSKAPTSAIGQKVAGASMQGSATADAALAAGAVGGSEGYES